MSTVILLFSTAITISRSPAQGEVYCDQHGEPIDSNHPCWGALGQATNELGLILADRHVNGVEPNTLNLLDLADCMETAINKVQFYIGNDSDAQHNVTLPNSVDVSSGYKCWTLDDHCNCIVLTPVNFTEENGVCRVRPDDRSGYAALGALMYHELHHAKTFENYLAPGLPGIHPTEYDDPCAAICNELQAYEIQRELLDAAMKAMAGSVPPEAWANIQNAYAVANSCVVTHEQMATDNGCACPEFHFNL